MLFRSGLEVPGGSAAPGVSAASAGPAVEVPGPAVAVPGPEVAVPGPETVVPADPAAAPGLQMSAVDDVSAEAAMSTWGDAVERDAVGLLAELDFSFPSDSWAGDGVADEDMDAVSAGLRRGRSSSSGEGSPSSSGEGPSVLTSTKARKKRKTRNGAGVAAPSPPPLSLANCFALLSGGTEDGGSSGLELFPPTAPESAVAGPVSLGTGAASDTAPGLAPDVPSGQDVDGWRQRQRETEREREGDRKSTRLNSSH